MIHALGIMNLILCGANCMSIICIPRIRWLSIPAAILSLGAGLLCVLRP